MAQQLFDWEGLDEYGQPKYVSGVTLKEAMEFDRLEAEGIRNRQSDVALAPELNKSVSNYLQSQQQGQLDTGNINPNNTQPDDSVLGGLDEIVASKEDTSELESVLSKIPTQSQPGVMSGIDTGIDQQPQQQSSGAMRSLFDGLPPEIVKDLLFEYRNNPQKMTPSKLFGEVKKLRREMLEIAQDKEKAEHVSGLKREEQGDKDAAAMDRTELQQQSATERANIAANARKASGSEGAFENARQKQAALRAVKFTESEKKMIGAVQEGKTLMTNLVNTYKDFGFGGGGQAAGEAAAKVPVIGKYLAGKNKEYQNQKEVVSETWLRAATGAAAPDTEVKRYAGFLPTESDPPEVAQAKLTNFFNKISAKADGRAAALKLEGDALKELGMDDFANVKYTQVKAIRNLISTSLESIPKIYEEPEGGNKGLVSPEQGDEGMQDEATISAPIQLPDNDIEADRIYESLPSGAEYIGPDGVKRRKP